MFKINTEKMIQQLLGRKALQLSHKVIQGLADEIPIIRETAQFAQTLLESFAQVFVA